MHKLSKKKQYQTASASILLIPSNDIIYVLDMYRVAQKCGKITLQILTDLRNYFTARIVRKLVIMLSLKIPPHDHTSSVSCL